MRAYALSLSGLIRLLGLKALAEGVDSSEDLAMLWQLGFDGATGTALRSVQASMAGKPVTRASTSARPPETSTQPL